MDQGLISPLTCGFARVAAYWSTKEAKSLFPSNKKLVGNSEFLQKRFSIFEKVFRSRKEAFNVDFRHFNKKILKLESTRRKANIFKYLLHFKLERVSI